MLRCLSRRFAMAVIALVAVAPNAMSANYCARHPGLAPVPPGLQREVARAFGIPRQAARGAMVRCVGDRLLACSIGANLNCGKANLERSLPAASAYCRANANTDFIPMFVTGHDPYTTGAASTAKPSRAKPSSPSTRKVLPPRTGKKSADRALKRGPHDAGS